MTRRHTLYGCFIEEVSRCGGVEFENLIFILSIVGLESLSARGPGRRDTCHLTDLFQTFTVYEGQKVIQESTVVRAPG